MANKYTKQNIDMDKAIELYESGMIQSEIAEELGTTRKVIWQRFKNIGYECRIAKKRNQSGSNNTNWSGNNPSYSAFHRRLQAMFGRPKKCEVCGTTDKKRTYDWANLTGKMDDPNDYKRMCRSCHWKYDKKHLNFKGAIGRRAIAK